MVGDFDNLIRVEVGLSLARVCVLRRKGSVLDQPNPNCFCAWHIAIGTNRSEAFPFGDALADDRLNRVCVVHQSTV